VISILKRSYTNI